ncbi:MAG: radical SAM protein [Dehalococcoidia bacterium]
MDIIDKLRILGGDSTVLNERDAATSPYVSLGERCGNTGLPGIYRAAAGGGCRTPLLRVLMTNICQFDCRYCSVNCHREVRRASFKPEELVRLFLDLHRRGTAAGLFLSSGVADAARTQERMLEVAALLRQREGFGGYIHLKLLPGITSDYVEEAARLASRLSINLEGTTPERLGVIAPMKDFHADLLTPMEAAARVKEKSPRLLPAGQVTQLVVGAAGESDRETLRAARSLYGFAGMRRVYYSAYHPVCGEVLAPPVPLAREHRLYQADWLGRFYDIPLEELTFDDYGNLPLAVDPKLLWALRHREGFPLEVNRASYGELIKVPGIGPRSAGRILAARRKQVFHTLAELAAIGTVVKRARHFLLLDGRYFGGRDVMEAQLEREPSPQQLPLWTPQEAPVPA